MELREFAARVVHSESLDLKLDPPPSGLTDEEPGEAERPESPGRPEALRFVPADQARVPPLEGLADRAQRVRILHAFANHELQAAELFGWALLAFPEAPREFRVEAAAILFEEQCHTRMYLARLADHGSALGDFPVSGYFWSKVPAIRTPLQFVCAMCLTFENANLDHTVEYAAAAAEAGDPKSAAVIEQI